MLLHAQPFDATVLLQQPPWWWIGFAVSTITALTFLAVGFVLASRLRQAGGFRGNPLAVGTGLIFITCGAGHLIHSMQLLYPLFIGSAYGVAARVHYMDWHLWVVDGFTAFAGTWYWLQRKRFPELVSGVVLYEDLRLRQQAAMDLNDTVVQELNAARLAMLVGDDEEARGHLRKATQQTEVT